MLIFVSGMLVSLAAYSFFDMMMQMPRQMMMPQMMVQPNNCDCKCKD